MTDGPPSVKVSPSKEIILVAGINYPEFKFSTSSNKWSFHSLSPGPWRNLCTAWARKAVKSDKTLQITLFDFSKGTREDLKFDSGGTPRASVEDDLGALDAGNYRRLDKSDASNPRLVPPERTLDRNRNDIHVNYYTGVSEVSKAAVDVSDYFSSFYGSSSSEPQESSIAITDVYDYLESVGKARPNTVIELHLFSHAWAGGPIFVNTWDLLQTT